MCLECLVGGPGPGPHTHDGDVSSGSAESHHIQGGRIQEWKTCVYDLPPMTISSIIHPCCIEQLSSLWDSRPSDWPRSWQIQPLLILYIIFLLFASDCCVTQYGQCPSGSPHHHHYLDNVACEVKSYVYFCLKHLELGHDWSKCG